MAKRKKLIRAGRLVLGIIYSAPSPSDPAHVRAAKSKASSAARQRINFRCACRKLELILAANFGTRDIVLTLTYRDADLPADKDEAVRHMRRFVRTLRDARAQVGESLRYVYVTESKHEHGRWHHHMVINGTGNDIEILRRLWNGADDVQMEPIDISGYAGLAEYFTKEPAEGHHKVGARMWAQSKGLKRPEVETGWAKDHETLTPPPGVIVLANESQQNEFGSYAYIKYLVPEYRPRKCRPSRKKRE